MKPWPILGSGEAGALQNSHLPVKEEAYEEKPIETFTGNETVYALPEQFPQTIPILKEAGFEKITNPMLRKTLGRVITIKRACEEQKVDFITSKPKIEVAMGRR